MQGPIQLGADCWILYPGCGVRPVAEGIAGSTPPRHDTESGSDPSFLMSLCEAGQQYVTVTEVHKKNVELMFVHGNSAIRNLDDVATASAACDKIIRWSATYLVDKAEERERLNSHPEYPQSKKHT